MRLRFCCGVLAACVSFTVATTASAHGFKALVFSKTAGFRHASIPDGIQCIEELGADHFAVDATEDGDAFTDANLAQYDVVIFLSTTGDVLTRPQEEAFERFIQRGGGYVGIHAASDTEYEWPWYTELVGAHFKSHPAIQDATIVVPDDVHPSTRHLPQRWDRRDEWYNYDRNPRGRVHVLARLDEDSYTGGAMGHDHPVAWCHEYDGGRSWYTGGGHTKESFLEPLFRQHLLGGILWAAGDERGDAGATIEAYYDKVPLERALSDPMEFSVAPDGRILIAERAGTVKVWDPKRRRTDVAGFVDVFDALEDGLLGVTVDPAFERNGWFYLYYSPRGDVPGQHLARFVLRDDNTFDADAGVVLLHVPTQRQECCHSGGSLAFGPDGNLFISTGDNTNPFASDGFAPIDEREDRAPWNAQDGPANPNDLRGKVLRIRPTRDGYTIPAGNLFPADGRAGRPEIYAMGCRNPFRIAIDPERGWLYWGDVGPDASDPNPARGPAGHDEFNQARGPGFFGWPYFTGPNLPYRDYDFATKTSGPAFDPAAPVNDAIGGIELPPAQPAWIGYRYGVTEAWPQLGEGGRCAMAGPVVHHRPWRAGPGALPAYFDDVVFLYEWARNWILVAHLDRAGDLLSLEPFLPSLDLRRPMDLELGPDGCLYLLEWGDAFGGGNRNAVLSRIEYHPRGERRPPYELVADRTSGAVPLYVRFQPRATRDDADDDAEFFFDFDDDGTIDSTARKPHMRWFEYTEPGAYVARVTARAPSGLTTTSVIEITAGNHAPELTVAWPPDGGVLGFGERLEYDVRAVDREDGALDDDDVIVRWSLGHDTHAHPLGQRAGVRGAFETARDDGHGDDADLYTVLTVRASDGGNGAAPPLEAEAMIILQPRRRQAEHFTRESGTQLEGVQDELGGRQSLAFIEDGDWASYAPLNLFGIEELRVRVASATQGGTIEVRAGAVDGPLAATVNVPHTGGWQAWQNVTATVNDPGGTHEYFFVFRGEKGGSLFNVNWLDFIGPGVTQRPTAP